MYKPEETLAVFFVINVTDKPLANATITLSAPSNLKMGKRRREARRQGRKKEEKEGREKRRREERRRKARREGRKREEEGRKRGE